MTSRERVRAAFAGQEPDKIPVDLSSRSTSIELDAYMALKDRLGIESETVTFLRDHVLLDTEVLELFQIDTEFVRAFPDHMYRTEPSGDRVFRDEWGVEWRRKADGLYFELDNRIFGGDAKICEMDWPEEILTEEQLQDMEQQATRLEAGTDRAVFCDYVGPAVFERAWYMRGLDTFLMELLTDEEFIHAYLARILDLQIAAYDRIIQRMGDKIDGFLVIDDVAMQTGPLISPDTYRTAIKPFHRRLFDHLHAADKLVIYHSCGSVTELIPDFIEAGIDALNPLQLSADNMDPVFLKKEFGKDIVFWGGGVSTQGTLEFGSPKDVRKEVSQRMEILADGGGYVFSAEHCIQPNTPVENILALFEAVNSFR